MNVTVSRLRSFWQRLLRWLHILPPDPHQIGPDVIIENPTHAAVVLEALDGSKIIISPGKSFRLKSPVRERGSYFTGPRDTLRVTKWDALYVAKDMIKQFEESRALGEWDPASETVPKLLSSGLKVRRVKKDE